MNLIGYYARRVRTALGRMRIRGYPLLVSMLVYLPRITIVRAYRILARPMNRGGVIRIVNRRRLRRLHAACGRAAVGGHFYVIVMPGTLHFLLPCLALLPRDLRVMLLGNGASSWERRLVARRFPALPFCSLARLPATSVTHGDVITLLLEGNAGNFGLIDHDCYVFDPRIFESLAPGPSDCLTAIFGGVSARTGLPYPETYFLFLHTAMLRELMTRYHVDARIYREVPVALREAVGRVGLGGGVFVKDHATFFDALHLLLALAIVNGHPCRFLQAFGSDAIAHLGGTSWQTTETKELIGCYVDWCFLDLANDEGLRRRYRYRTRPFSSVAHVRSSIPLTPEAFARLAVIDALVARLASVTARSADRSMRCQERG